MFNPETTRKATVLIRKTYRFEDHRNTTLDQLAGEQGRISDELLTIFKECNGNIPLFDKLCKKVEAIAKAERKANKQDAKLPRAWTQTKSDIKAAHKAGVEVMQQASYSAMKKAKIAANKAAKESEGSEVTVEEAQDSPTLAMRADFLQMLGNLPTAKQEELMSKWIDEMTAVALEEHVKAEEQEPEQEQYLAAV